VDPDPLREEPEFDPIREELNLSILQLAILLAQIEEAELHVVHVWPFHLERLLQGPAGLTADAVAKAGESIRQKHEWALGELVGPFMQQISRVHLLKGDAKEEVPRLAAAEPFDVIVMGTVCRTGIPGLLIGNTAETVLDQVDCSIVALKPRGFVSPVHT
jgi:nucleotide-binding universal stress UspA family protein